MLVVSAEPVTECNYAMALGADSHAMRQTDRTDRTNRAGPCSFSSMALVGASLAPGWFRGSFRTDVEGTPAADWLAPAYCSESTALWGRGMGMGKALPPSSDQWPPQPQATGKWEG